MQILMVTTLTEFINTLGTLSIGGIGFWTLLKLYTKGVEYLAQRRTLAPVNGNGSASAALKILAVNQANEVLLAHIREAVGEEITKVHTFATQPDVYWRNMDETLNKVVGKPITNILDRQTAILSQLAQYAAEERGIRLNEKNPDTPRRKRK